ncbi:MAG: type II 3-dehydroquinate dehydratase [Deltaproteobacteria bacterium]|nr:type II 3-dehydroquinate dehydratase [Deltaproteobacteria bacterium]
MKKIVIINGPNLNMLGKREPELYGDTTLEQINAELCEIGRQKKVCVEIFQSNHEGAIIDKIQAISDQCAGLIINPGAFTHTSIAIRDALLLIDAPIIEIHLSNIYKRETFRHKSVISDIAVGQITGFGEAGYFFALKTLISDISVRSDYNE